MCCKKQEYMDLTPLNEVARDKIKHYLKCYKENIKKQKRQQSLRV